MEIPTPAHQPNVVKFGYHDFRVRQKLVKGILRCKIHAKCNSCNVDISETRGTTSSFTRYVSMSI